MDRSDLKDLSIEQLDVLRASLGEHQREFGWEMPHLSSADPHVDRILDVVNDNVSSVARELIEAHLAIVDEELASRPEGRKAAH